MKKEKIRIDRFADTDLQNIKILKSRKILPKEYIEYQKKFKKPEPLEKPE